ncbi:hypothetical protein GKR67_17750 [Providencia alcalifaciens]|uniref:Uncharacterized protein n=1 Tax=Providencia alcalifaciens TaxID=126385 RepID=A0AAW9VEI5_9GAMM|nr:hypothetical protein [Providencia alcalifaciens]
MRCNRSIATSEIQIAPRHYRQNLTALYQQLPNSLEVQQNVDVNQQTPLKQVDFIYVDSCMRVFVNDKELG